MNANYKVIYETLHDGEGKQIGRSVLLLKWSRKADDVVGCIEDKTIYHGKSKDVHYGLVESEAYFNDIDYAKSEFYNTAKLLNNY